MLSLHLKGLLVCVRESVQVLSSFPSVVSGIGLGSLVMYSKCFAHQAHYPSLHHHPSLHVFKYKFKFRWKHIILLG